MSEEINPLEEDSLLKSLLWTARIYGAAVLAIVLYLSVNEYIEELRNGASLLEPIRLIISGGHILLFLPWVVAGFGLVLAFWKEGSGGIVSLIGFIGAIVALGFHIAVFIVVSLASVPSILYLIYWWQVFQANRKRNETLQS